MSNENNFEKQSFTEREKARQYRDLAYDVESFLIDLVYHSGEAVDPDDIVKQEIIGKEKVKGQVLNDKKTEKMRKCLVDVLLQMGIPNNLKGFRLLIDCVVDCVNQNIVSGRHLLKNAYPVLAEKYSISKNGAEKLIRYACAFVDVKKIKQSNKQIYGILSRRTVENITLLEVVNVLMEYLMKKYKIKSRL